MAITMNVPDEDQDVMQDDSPVENKAAVSDDSGMQVPDSTPTMGTAAPAAPAAPASPTMTPPDVGELPTSGSPTPSLESTPPQDGKKQFHDTINYFENAATTTRGKMLSLDPNDPNYLQKLSAYQTQEGLIRNERAKFEQSHPWGSPDSAHPGILGKIGSVAGRVGQGALTMVAPELEAAIPGSQLNLGEQAGAGAHEMQTGEAGMKTAADINAENLKQPVMHTPEETTFNDLMTGQNGQPRMNPATHQPYTTTEAYGEVKQAGTVTKPEPPRFEKDDEGNWIQFTTDPKTNKTTAQVVYHGDPKVDTDVVERTVNGQEHHVLVNKRDGSDIKDLGKFTPAAVTAAASRNADKFYTYSDPSGATHMVKGDQLPPDHADDALPVKDPEALVTEAGTANIVQKSLNQVAQDVHQHPELWDNATARNIMATTLEQIDREQAGLLISGTGGSIPLPSGMGDMINTALQNKALDAKTADALKQYVADYKSMKDKVITMQMDMQGGKIGRGSAQAFKAIADQIPNGATPDSKTAVRQLNNLQQTQNELMRKYPDSFGNYTKEKPLDTTSVAGHSFTFNGKTYANVPDDVYNKYKGQPGFKE